MKKILLFLSAAALLLAGCAKEELKPGSEGEGQEVDVALSMNIQSLPAVKGSADGDGQGANANRCILEIYYQGTLYQRMVSKVSNKTASFTPRLVTNRTYDVIFWADCAAENADGSFTDLYYNAQDLKAVEMLSTTYGANDDKRDAFFVKDQVKVTQQGSDKNSFSLKRPFAQLNVVTTDIASIDREALYPATVNMKYTAPTTFNCMTGEVSGDQPITVSGGTYATFDKTKSELTLEMDYLFAAGERSVVDIAFEAERTGESTVSHNFNNIPVQRNYRTNIKGALLTTTSNWVATIKPEWDGEIDSKVVEAGSVEAANKALQEGKTAIVITNPGDAGSPVVFPKSSEAGPGVDGLTVSIKATGLPADATLTFKNEEGAQGPASLLIDSDAKNLVVNTPNTHVNIVGGSYDSVEATTSATTLVVEKGVTIASLDIKQGNVRIYGKVAALTRVNGVKAEMYASDAATLANYIGWGKAGDLVVLANDIDLSGVTWASPELKADFDGNDHVIKNMKNPDCAPDYAGLFKVSYSNIKNVTIQNAEFVYGATKDARGGALVGDMRKGSIENCHVDGINFTGYQKVGGLVGYISANADDGNAMSIKNCSVKNAFFAACGADDGYLYQTGGLVGYIQLGNRNISISNCSVENIKYDNTKYKGVFNDASDNHGYLSHTFVGVIFTETNNAGNTLSFTANTISGDNTPLKASGYGSAYFGWARNAEYKPTEVVTLGRITIDGKEWAPNYIAEIPETQMRYTTLSDAFKAVAAGQTVQILKAGNYTVQTLSINAANVIVEATVEGVVFNHTPGYEQWIANSNNTTVKNITWNVGTASFQYFHGVNLVKCKVNGLVCTHTNNTYTECEFYNADDYNFWDYATGSTFINCKFTCPGADKGGAINAFNSGYQGGLKKLILKNCVFEALNQSNKYAAIYIKPENEFDVQFTDCTTNDKFADGAISGSKLWNVKDNSNLKTMVTVDGQVVYANGIVLALSTPAQLKAFANAVNSGKSFAGLTVFLGANIDMNGEEMTAIGTGNNKFSGTFDGKGKTIENFVINNSSADNQGLFGPVFGATIKDLTIKNGKVTGKERVGALVGTGYMNVDNVTVDGCIVNGEEQAGGIAGFISSGSIKNCKINATVTGTKRAGGVVGKCQADNHFAIEGNTVKGTITSTEADGNYTAGGIACQIMWGQGSSIKNNVIDADIICAGQKSNCPIGDYRAGGYYADMANGIVGNKWTKSRFTANKDSYTFTIGKPDGVDAVTTLNAAD